MFGEGSVEVSWGKCWSPVAPDLYATWFELL
jgi:hypothetical protein